MLTQNLSRHLNLQILLHSSQLHSSTTTLGLTNDQQNQSLMLSQDRTVNSIIQLGKTCLWNLGGERELILESKVVICNHKQIGIRCQFSCCAVNFPNLSKTDTRSRLVLKCGEID